MASAADMQAFAQELLERCAAANAEYNHGAETDGKEIIPTSLVLLRDDLVKRVKVVNCGNCKNWAHIVARRLPVAGLESNVGTHQPLDLSEVKLDSTVVGTLPVALPSVDDSPASAAAIQGLVDAINAHVKNVEADASQTSVDKIFPFVTFTDDDLPTDTAALPLLRLLYMHKANLAFAASVLSPEGLQLLAAAREANAAFNARKECHAKTDDLPSQLEDRRKILNNKVESSRRECVKDVREQRQRCWERAAEVAALVTAWSNRANALVKNCQVAYDEFVLERIRVAPTFTDSWESAMAGAQDSDEDMAARAAKVFSDYLVRMEQTTDAWTQTLQLMYERLLRDLDAVVQSLDAVLASTSDSDGAGRAALAGISARLDQVRDSRLWESSIPADITSLIASIQEEWPATGGYPAMREKASSKDFKKKVRRLENKMSEWRQTMTDQAKKLVNECGLGNAWQLALRATSTDAEANEAAAMQELRDKYTAKAEDLRVQAMVLKRRYTVAAGSGWQRLHALLGEMVWSQLDAARHVAAVDRSATQFTTLVLRSTQGNESGSGRTTPQPTNSTDSSTGKAPGKTGKKKKQTQASTPSATNSISPKPAADPSTATTNTAAKATTRANASPKPAADPSTATTTTAAKATTRANASPKPAADTSTTTTTTAAKSTTRGNASPKPAPTASSPTTTAAAAVAHSVQDNTTVPSLNGSVRASTPPSGSKGTKKTAAARTVQQQQQHAMGAPRETASSTAPTTTAASVSGPSFAAAAAAGAGSGTKAAGKVQDQRAESPSSSSSMSSVSAQLHVGKPPVLGQHTPPPTTTSTSTRASHTAAEEQQQLTTPPQLPQQGMPSAAPHTPTDAELQAVEAELRTHVDAVLAQYTPQELAIWHVQSAAAQTRQAAQLQMMATRAHESELRAEQYRNLLQSQEQQLLALAQQNGQLQLLVQQLQTQLQVAEARAASMLSAAATRQTSMPDTRTGEHAAADSPAAERSRHAYRPSRRDELDSRGQRPGPTQESSWRSIGGSSDHTPTRAGQYGKGPTFASSPAASSDELRFRPPAGLSRQGSAPLTVHQQQQRPGGDRDRDWERGGDREYARGALASDSAGRLASAGTTEGGAASNSGTAGAEATWERKNPPFAKVFCGNCGGTGHTSFACKVPCRYCGGEHLAEHCPRPR